MQRNRINKWIGPMCTVMLLVTSGCGNQAGQGQGQGAEAHNSQMHGMGMQSVGHEHEEYNVSGDDTNPQTAMRNDRDQQMGRNQNPNLIIGHSAVRGYQVDTRNMQMMAKSVPGVENARITINGSNAFVTLDLIPNVTAAQARTIERRVIEALRQKVPRYDFHITSNDGYHNGGQ